MNLTATDIKKLREETGAGIMDCKKALEESKGDYQKAQEWLKAKGLKKAESRSEREVKSGVVEVYSHCEGQVVGLVELLSETDFVARNEEFKKLAHELAMQVAAMNPKNVADLMEQNYIRDEAVKIGDLLKDLIAKTGENIVVRRIARFELGEELADF